MKIALIGYGKMGKMIEQVADDKGHKIIGYFSRQFGMPLERKQDLIQADLVIDFSHFSSVLDHLQLCLSLNKPMIIGTTGWEDRLTTAQELVLQHKGSCLYSPNFSVSSYLFHQIIGYAASVFQPFAEYDVCAIELHHRQKIDQPSGTAKALKQQLLQNMPRLESIDFTSIRCGNIPGTHTVHFDGPEASLILSHQARNRQGFAEGAVMAGEWLLNRIGFFTFADMMQDYQTIRKS